MRQVKILVPTEDGFILNVVKTSKIYQLKKLTKLTSGSAPIALITSPIVIRKMSLNTLRAKTGRQE